MKKTTKITLFAGIGSLASISVAIPVVLAQKNEDNKKIMFQDQVFNSKQELLRYIDVNHESLKSDKNNKIFSVNVGNDIKTFKKYKAATDFIKSKLIEKEVYLDPKITQDDLIGEINPESYVERKGTDLYVVFEKYNPKSTEENPTRSYVFAKKPIPGRDDYNRLLKEYKRARNEAASSFIQVHNAYYYDDIYFSTLNDLRDYVNTHRDDNHQFNSYLENTTQTVLITEDGGNLFYKLPKDINLDKENYLFNNSSFKNGVMNLAKPILTRNINGTEIETEIEQNNFAVISQMLNEKELDYIKVSPNDGIITQIVDMDNSTKNGNFYGEYFVKSAIGMDQISEKDNWKLTDQSKSGIGELYEVATLKSVVAYLLNNKGISSPIDLFNMTSIGDKDKTSFLDYLGSFNNRDNISYAKLANDFVYNLSKGVRYNHLDTIIALHSYLINEMIQSKEKTEVIIKLSKYFDSMAAILDSFLAQFIAPMLSIDNNGYRWTDDEYEINYFRKTFSFYDKTKLGQGIDFQLSPLSYYRKLIGGNGEVDSKTNRKSNSVILKMIKSAMAVQIISMCSFRHNEVTYLDYLESFKKFLSDKEKNIYLETNKLPALLVSNNLEESKIHKLSFNSSNTSNKEQKESIWGILQKIDNDLVITDKKGKDHTFSKTDIITNYQNYLLKSQNSIIKKYLDNINENINNLKEKYVFGQKNGQSKKDPIPFSKIDSKDFEKSTFRFLNDINLNNLYLSLPTQHSRNETFKKMTESVIKPLRERIVDFATPIATVATQAVIGVMTAGITSEAAMVEGAFSKYIKSGFKSSEASKFTKALARTSNLTKEQVYRKKFSKDALSSNKKALLKDMVSNINSASGNKSNDLSKSIGDFIGSTYGSVLKTFGFGDEIAGTISEVVAIASEITFNVAKNIIPGLSSIINIINSFSKTEHNVYVNDKNDRGSKFFWDGDVVEYSWWGLSANHKYSINDLKMIEAKTIISGYSSTGSGYYSDGEIKSLDDIKLEKANDIIEKYTRLSRNSFLENPNLEENGIVWTLKLKNRENIVENTLEELVKKAANIAANTSFPNKVYGNKTKGQKATWDAWVDETLLPNQKKVLILGLPKIDAFGKKTKDKYFSLPKNYYENGRIIRKENNDENANYIIFNPNFDSGLIKKIQNSEISVASDNKTPLSKVKENLINALIDTSNELNVANTSALSEFVSKYAENIYVETKEVLFEEINQNKTGIKADNDYERGTFESISTDLTNNLKTLYGYVDSSGQQKYYLHSKDALARIMASDNYNFNAIKINRGQIYYVFNDITFTSKNAMYQYVLERTKEVN